MPERVLRLFRVRCGNCATVLMAVPLLGAEEAAHCATHIRSCWRHDPLPKHPALGEVMRLVRVSIVGIGSETPPRLH